MNLLKSRVKKEDITVFEANTTFSDDGKPTYTAKTVKGCWFDSKTVIQTGLNTSVISKANVILVSDVMDNSKIERGTKTVVSTTTNAIIKKEILKNHMTGEVEGVVIYL
jgi:hypothetical protein